MKEIESYLSQLPERPFPAKEQDWAMMQARMNGRGRLRYLTFLLPLSLLFLSQSSEPVKPGFQSQVSTIETSSFSKADVSRTKGRVTKKSTPLYSESVELGAQRTIAAEATLSQVVSLSIRRDQDLAKHGQRPTLRNKKPLVAPLTSSDQKAGLSGAMEERLGVQNIRLSVIPSRIARLMPRLPFHRESYSDPSDIINRPYSNENGIRIRKNALSVHAGWQFGGQFNREGSEEETIQPGSVQREFGLTYTRYLSPRWNIGIGFNTWNTQHTYSTIDVANNGRWQVETNSAWHPTDSTLTGSGWVYTDSAYITHSDSSYLDQFDTASNTHNVREQYVSIPILVGYAWHRGRWRLGLQTGLSLDVRIATNDSERSDPRLLATALQLSVPIGYQWSHHWALGCQSTMRWRLSNQPRIPGRLLTVRAFLAYRF